MRVSSVVIYNKTMANMWHSSGMFWKLELWSGGISAEHEIKISFVYIIDKIIEMQYELAKSQRLPFYKQYFERRFLQWNIDDLVQDCGNSSALAMYSYCNLALSHRHSINTLRVHGNSILSSNFNSYPCLMHIYIYIYLYRVSTTIRISLSINQEQKTSRDGSSQRLPLNTDWNIYSEGKSLH